MVYDNIYVNFLNVYNKYNGKFIVFVKGIYVFFVNVFIFLGKKLEVLIVWNGVNFCNIYVGIGMGYGFGFNMVVVVLEVGDVVWVKVYVYDFGVYLDGLWILFLGFFFYEIFEYWIYVEL